MKKIFYLLPIICSLICFNSWALNQPMRANRPIIAQYFGLWNGSNQLWTQKFRDNTPFNKLNRLYITDGKIVKTPDGHFTISFADMQHANELLTRMRTDNPNAEIFISVSGDGGVNAYGGAAHDDKFAENVATFLRQNNLSGLNVDWRLSLTKADLTMLLKKCYEILHPLGYQLTFDVWQFVSPQYDVPVIKNYLDQINIMSYGTGISLEVCASDYMRSGFSAQQIIGSIESETGYKQYGGVTDTLGSHGSIRKKAGYAKRAGLAGVANWRLDNDYAPKTNILYPEYQGAQELWDEMTT